MTAIQIFKHPQFGDIRCMKDDKGEPWFVGKDVAQVLGYKNLNDALTKHVDDEDKGVAKCDTLGGKQKTIIINESGLYSLILSSKLPQAKEFKHWVTGIVLPQIRKTGGYIPLSDDEGLRMNDEEIMARALVIAQKTIELKDKLLEAQKPKVEYAEKVLLSPSCYTMTQIAKELSMTVYELTQKLTELGIIYRSPSGPLMLYADYLKHGYEAYRTRKGQDLFGNTLWTDHYLVWTEHGREFIHSIFN